MRAVFHDDIVVATLKRFNAEVMELVDHVFHDDIVVATLKLFQMPSR